MSASVPAGASAGFSLVETLVALAVIAMMSGLFFDSIGTNANLSRTVAARREAVLLAQSLLAAATAPSDSRNVADSGSSRNLRWRITRLSRGGDARDGGIPLEEVRIEIADRTTGRPLTSVHTLRLAR
ncbi:MULTISPECIES: prepilin-type N-terminal cleavage/methylation domain-containing protein [unclassified Sphingomonas]|jgi:prepilin-type N-terminal cleavage/methylation domain-containing protein|uniref:type II secretion system protein n=1 Tax=unclassified Sphingomonas TaxID=196159 RepID=UPI000A55B7A5|nr:MULTISPECIES: prepilin-type N-terminal cleavage/methylation domain-containing protein [unclassified Sphingomonas]